MSSRAVHFHGAAEAWARAVVQLADGRWRWAMPADVVVVDQADELPPVDSLVLVVDARRTPPPDDIVAAFKGGADGYVCNADPTLVLAHLDALGRALGRDFTANPSTGPREDPRTERTVE